VNSKKLALLCFVAFLFTGVVARPGICRAAQDTEANRPTQTQQKIPAGSRVYIASMDGFETYLKAAIVKKKVPIEIVEQREKADFEITGVADSKKAGAAKVVIMGSWHSTEDASIKVSSLKSGEIVYAYSVHKENSTHGKHSSAEACAKHLKDDGVASK
jgi:hypothetical protein